MLTDLLAAVLVLRDKVPDFEGTYGYEAGVSGIGVTLPAGARVLGGTAAATANGATVSIDGGDAIPIPVPTSGVGAIDLGPACNLEDPTFDFNGTAMYLIEYVV